MIGEFAALGAALCWTVAAVLYKRALAATTPLSANTLRCIGTSLILVLFLAFIGKIRVLTDLPIQAVFLACASGVVGLGLGDTLYMLSLKIIGVSRAVPITCTYPLFSLVWAYLLAGENITVQILLGAVTIVLGIWLLSREAKNASVKAWRKLHVKGLAFALSTAIAWSISISMINLAVRETSSLEYAYAINTVRILAVALSLLILTLASRNEAFIKAEWKTTAMLLTGGLIAVGLGWFLLTFSFTKIPEAQAVPISSTTPLFSTLAGIAFLHEKVTAKVALGSIFIVVGIFLVFID